MKKNCDQQANTAGFPPANFAKTMLRFVNTIGGTLTSPVGRRDRRWRIFSEPQNPKLFDAAVIFLFNKSSFRSRRSPMTSKFSIPANEAQAYSLMRTYGITDDELNDYISTMLGEIKILAEYAKLSGVANHVKAAISELETAKVPGSL
jgi:hypothetical protein